MSAADFRKVIDVDLNAPFIVSKAVIPSMIKKGHGKIINICSMMSELGRETVSAYAAAKGGLKMLTRNICSEYGEHNIQCNGIGPGYIETPQTAPLRERQADGSRHPFDQFIISKTPAARWGKTEDLVGPAVPCAGQDHRADHVVLHRRRVPPYPQCLPLCCAAVRFCVAVPYPVYILLWLGPAASPERYL